MFLTRSLARSFLRSQFAENPFFENKLLTKTYSIPNLYLDDEPMLEKITGTPIKWKPTKCLTHTTTTRKQRSKSGKNKGAIRTVTKSVKVDSFFNFFSDINVPSDEDGSMNSEDADLLEGIIDQDYDAACAFRSMIVPDAIDWFTGEANGEDESDDEDNELEEGDSSDDDDDDDDTDDDDQVSVGGGRWFDLHSLKFDSASENSGGCF